MMSKIPYDVIFAPGYDPKEAYDALYPHYMEMQLEGQKQKVRFRDREVWFFPADLTQWEKVMARLRQEAGLTSNRFAITAG